MVLLLLVLLVSASFAQLNTTSAQNNEIVTFVDNFFSLFVFPCEKWVSTLPWVFFFVAACWFRERIKRRKPLTSHFLFIYF
jgi:hypothetical protein